MVFSGQSSLMYFPTEVKETYRILAVVGRLSMSVKSREEIKIQIGEHNYDNIFRQSVSEGIINPINGLYHYFLEKDDYETIHKHFEIAFGYSYKQTITIADLFAGEGKWLELFKTGIPNEEVGSANLHLIANELETGRYQKCKNNTLIDESHNQSFEEFNGIPSNSVSLMLYNPPYGDTNGVRNVKHYLQMIIDRNLIYSPHGYSHKHGRIVMVIREDDLLDSLPLIAQYFMISKSTLYRVNEEEYKKYKQYVVYATLRQNPLDIKTVSGSMELQSEVEEINKIVESKPEFKSSMYGMRNFELADVPYEEMRRNHKIVQDDLFHVSESNNDNWQWIKEITEIKDIASEKIMKPIPLKVGEIANLIASGMINGEMDINGQGKHIVAGGTKEQVKEEVSIEELPNGEKQKAVNTVLYSEPYLNVLVNDNGKAVIKELSGGNAI